MIWLTRGDVILGLVVISLAVLTAGFGGWAIGRMTGFDAGYREHEEWCDHHHGPDKPAPVTEQRYDPANPWRLPGRHAGPRRSRLELAELAAHETGPARGQALEHYAALSGILTAADRPPKAPGLELPTSAPTRHVVTSPALVELEVGQMIEDNEREIQALIRHAETTIGELPL